MRIKCLIFLLKLVLLGFTDPTVLIGTWSELDTNDAGLNTALTETFQTLKSHLRHGLNADVKIGEVISAESKIADGVKYLTVVGLEFKRYNSPHCPIKTQICILEIWRSPSLNTYNLNSYECQKPVFQGLPVDIEGDACHSVCGGILQEEDLNSDNLRRLAAFSLNFIQRTIPTNVQLSFSRILDATYQITVTCYFKVSDELRGRLQLKEYDCNDDLFAH